MDKNKYEAKVKIEKMCNFFINKETNQNREMLLCLLTAAAAAKLLQSCPTLCDPIDGSTPGSSVPGFLQARTLEWVAMSFSNAWKWKVKVKLLSRVWLFATPWSVAYQAPPFIGFSRQKCSEWVAISCSCLLTR